MSPETPSINELQDLPKPDEGRTRAAALGAKERSAFAWPLIVQGLPYRDIARRVSLQFGRRVSIDAIFRYRRFVLKRLNEQEEEAAKEYRRLEAERLDHYRVLTYGRLTATATVERDGKKYLDPAKIDLECVRELVKISESYRRLYDLDKAKPVQQGQEGGRGDGDIISIFAQVLATVPVEDMAGLLAPGGLKRIAPPPEVGADLAPSPGTADGGAQ